MSNEPDLLTIHEVGRLFGGDRPFHRTTVQRWVKEGRIPKPINVGPQQKRWRRSECLEALQAMNEASHQDGDE